MSAFFSARKSPAFLRPVWLSEVIGMSYLI
jgi:hypothetical protein